MSALDNDTIIALSSAPVASALAIFRVSGLSTRRLLTNIVGFILKIESQHFQSLKVLIIGYLIKVWCFFRALNLSLVRIYVNFKFMEV